MLSANAILAINSLDRFIKPGTTTFNNQLQGGWGTGTNAIVYQGGAEPVMGAVVTSAVLGWPVGVVTITYWQPGGAFFYISANTTAASPAPGGNTIQQVFTIVNATNPTSNALAAQYNNQGPPANNFQIQSPGALIYGYLDRLVVSQIQIQYNIPTVSKGKNDVFVIATAGPVFTSITIPYGFYSATELAAAMQTLITNNPTLSALNMTVTFVPRAGFQFTSTAGIQFYFPDPNAVSGVANSTVVYKSYRLLGMTVANALPAVFQPSSDYPNFLYSPYVDIYSDVLTNYQKVKDTNTSTTKKKGMVARVYLSGTGNIQVTQTTDALGTQPFVMTADLNNPKVIQWSTDVAVPNIDFQVYDQYEDLIPGGDEGFSTEFQITLLCIEG